MPNHVTNKLLFATDKADEVFKAVCPDGKFDFELLVQQPAHLYQGGISSIDEEDFPLNWHSWNVENWGTKWNCYDQTCGIENGRAFIQFDTAWSVPYPILAAFCNKFQIPFEHRYYDEGSNFWGIERWGLKPYDEKHICRIDKQRSLPEHEKMLCIELKGYDPDERDEE